MAIRLGESECTRRITTTGVRFGGDIDEDKSAYITNVLRKRGLSLDSGQWGKPGSQRVEVRKAPDVKIRTKIKNGRFVVERIQG